MSRRATSRWDPAEDEIRDREPYDYGEAKAAEARGSRDQAKAAEWRAETAKDYGNAERAYRVALAQEIVRLREAGWPATVCADLARGDERVARLGMERRVAEGLREAAEGASWQASANRKTLERLVKWSMMVAPLGEYPQS